MGFLTWEKVTGKTWVLILFLVILAVLLMVILMMVPEMQNIADMIRLL